MRNVTVADLINDKIAPFALCDSNLSYDKVVDESTESTAWQDEIPLEETRADPV